MNLYLPKLNYGVTTFTWIQMKENDLRSAFKYNALIQIKGLSATEAKKEYIKLVAQHIP